MIATLALGKMSDIEERERAINSKAEYLDDLEKQWEKKMPKKSNKNSIIGKYMVTDSDNESATSSPNITRNNNNNTPTELTWEQELALANNNPAQGNAGIIAENNTEELEEKVRTLEGELKKTQEERESSRTQYESEIQRLLADLKQKQVYNHIYLHPIHLSISRYLYPFLIYSLSPYV